jgi:hypothetical protein
MPIDMTQSLFGPTPEQIQAQRQSQIDQAAQSYAQMPAGERAAMGMYQAGAGLGSIAGGLFGLQDPNVLKAQQTQQALAGVDTNDPSALLQAAVAMRAIDPQRAAAMVKMAQDRQKEIADLELTKAHAKYYETPKTGGNVDAQLAAKQAITRRTALAQGYQAGLSGNDLETYAQQQVDLMTNQWNQTIGKPAATGPNTPAGYTGSNGVVGTPVSPNTAINFTQPPSKASLDAAIADAQARGDTQAVAALQAITPAVQPKSKIEQEAALTAARLQAKNENTPTISPDDARTAITMWKNGDQSLMNGWGRSPTSRKVIMDELTSQLKSGEVTPEQFVQAKIDVATRTGTEKAFAYGPLSNTVTAIGVANRHLDLYQQLADAQQKGDVQGFNKVRAMWQQQFGSALPTNPELAANIIGTEIVKALGVAGAGTQAERDEMAKRFSNIASPEQTSGAVSTARGLLAGQAQGKAIQYQAGTKKGDFYDKFKMNPDGSPAPVNAAPTVSIRKYNPATRKIE